MSGAARAATPAAAAVIDAATPPPVDPHNGRVTGARSGSELNYDTLMRRLPPGLADPFQIIVSRVRECLPDKWRILWCQDMWHDVEAQHLTRLESRLRFEKVVCVSHYQLNTFTQAFRLPHSGAIVLRNAIEPIDADLDAKPTDQIRLVYHTTPHRGLEILLPVFAALAASRPHLHLDVYSSFGVYGWEQRDAMYAPLFDACRAHPQITYHGSVPNDRIRAALRQAHIFAYPSIWEETSCVASMEAMSAGCLVVCPDLAALAETVSDYFGLMYRWTERPRDHAARFASALTAGIELIERNAARDRLLAAQARVRALFNWETRIGEWTALLEQIRDEHQRAEASCHRSHLTPA